jgi:ketosteroid isomerase-like protein
MSASPGAKHASPEVQTVFAWHDALNDGDVERLVGLSHPDVGVGGPRGTSQGAHILREWVDRANIHLEPGRIFHEADTVVVEQAAAWTSADTGETTPAQTVASVFVVRDCVVTTVVRYPNLVEALLALDLDQSQETKPE